MLTVKDLSHTIRDPATSDSVTALDSQADEAEVLARLPGRVEVVLLFCPGDPGQEPG
ncbi:MAG: hypothetical protein QGI93_01030 [Planctomycetota bacterium]|nr:hypothetical protein [Planctomycetota bacterium]MDP6939113.1 hypothetical protein [Planctomycetota bacterium]